MEVTGDPEDAGEVKIPSLRNVALRPRYMHTGQFSNLGAAIGFYVTGAALEDRDDIPNGGIYSFNMSSITERRTLSTASAFIRMPSLAIIIKPMPSALLKRSQGRPWTALTFAKS